MTNNLEDFEQPDAGQGGELPPAVGARAKLMHAWRTRPLFKLLVLMVVVGAIIAVSMSFFSATPPTSVSHLVSPPQLKEPPGGAASPYFLEQQKIADKDRETNALKTGGSAIPTPVGENAGVDEMVGKEQPKRDPLIELKGEIEHQNQEIQQMRQQAQQAAQQQAQPQQAAPKPPEQFDNTLAQAMQAQLRQLMTGWEPHGIKEVGGGGLRDLEEERAKKLKGGAGGELGSLAPEQQPVLPPKVLIPAGTVSYAQMLTEANSDVPGPILAQILSGPLNGARAIGAFEVMNEYLVMHFKLANLKGTDYRIDSLALDPDTTLGGMATEVDERYVTRVLLPAAASFMQGLGAALGQQPQSLVTNGTTTIVTQSGAGIQQGMFLGLSEAGKTIGQFFQDQANHTHVLVRVAAGTPMGLFFLNSVFEKNPNFPPGYGPTGPYAGTGYGYSGYGGYGSGYGAYGPGYGYAGMPGSYNPGMVGGYGVQQSAYGGNASSSTPYSPSSYNSSGPYPSAGNSYNSSPGPGYNTGGFGSTTNYPPGVYGAGSPMLNP